MDLFEAIYSQRAMRRLKSDPVPDELIWKVLDAAIRAPSGGNRQPWNFIGIKDEATKKQIAEWYLDSWNAAYGARRRWPSPRCRRRSPPPITSPTTWRKSRCSSSPW